jgi:hypothetical protein
VKAGGKQSMGYGNLAYISTLKMEAICSCEKVD